MSTTYAGYNPGGTYGHPPPPEENPPPPPAGGGSTPPPGVDRNSYAWRLAKSLGLTDTEADRFTKMYLDQDSEGAWGFAITTAGFKSRSPGFQSGFQHWQGGSIAEKYGSYTNAKSDWDKAAAKYHYTPTAADYENWATNGWTGNDVDAHLGAKQPTAGDAMLKRWGFTDAQIQIWKDGNAGIGTGKDAQGRDIKEFGNYIINNGYHLERVGYTTFGSAYNAFQHNPTGEDLSHLPSLVGGQDSSGGSGAADQAAAEARQEAERKARIERAAQTIMAGYDPSIAALFTADELHNAAIWDAGGEWGDAKAAREIALASPVNQYFQHFYGRAVTRAEIDQYYASGATPEYVNQTLDSLGIQRAFPVVLQGMFTPDEIKMYSDELAGIHTPTGKHIKDLVDGALAFNPLYQQYQGRSATRAEIEAHVAAGDTPDKVRGVFGGQTWMDANRPDVQYYTGAFGEGQLTPDQQAALGQNQAGYTTPLGANLQFKFDKAVERARTSFQGTLAHMERTTPFGTQAGQLPDIGV